VSIEYQPPRVGSVEAGIVEADLPRRISRALGALLQGVYNVWSEGDSLWRPFHGPLDTSAPLTPEEFRAAASLASSMPVESLPLAQYIDWTQDEAAGLPVVSKAAYAAAGATLAALTADPQAFVAGRGASVRVRLFFVGRVPGGGVAGVQTFSIET
jgi:Nuclease A inhibitor-like protein